jgi:cytochrome c oxidase assembly factor CtaG
MVVGAALASPIASYDAVLFWVHMIQHLLLTQVAAPLLVLGAPLALTMRAGPRAATERLSSVMRWGPLRAVMHPLVAWSAFALAMSVTHFSGFYGAALEEEHLHALEHCLYLGAGVLFWWPVAGVDPGAAGRLSWPVRLAYVLVALPQQAFLGLAIYSARTVLYRHYETVTRAWGPEPIQDQRIAGMIMWIAGDLLFLVALGFIAVAWMRSDIKEAARIDRRLDRMKA